MAAGWSDGPPLDRARDCPAIAVDTDKYRLAARQRLLPMRLRRARHPGLGVATRTRSAAEAALTGPSEDRCRSGGDGALSVVPQLTDDLVRAQHRSRRDIGAIGAIGPVRP